MADGEITSLQAALRGVEAAMWGYGVVGARLAGDDADQAEADYDAYREIRDRLRRLLRDRSARPTPARAAYRLPFPVTSAHACRRLAARLETRNAAVFADLAAATSDGQLRSYAADQLRRATNRAATWGHETPAFPGLAERDG